MRSFEPSRTARLVAARARVPTTRTLGRPTTEAGTGSRPAGAAVVAAGPLPIRTAAVTVVPTGALVVLPATLAALGGAVTTDPIAS